MSLPVSRAPSAGTSMSTCWPARTSAACCSGTSAVTHTSDRSATTYSASAGWTTWPWVMLRSTTVPATVDTTGVTELIAPLLPSREIAAADMPSTRSWSAAARCSAEAIASSLSRRWSSARPITSAANSWRARSTLRACRSAWARALM